MTPITDHARINRERLINGDEAARCMHFKALVKQGVDEVEAANRAGWHPILPVDKFIRKFAWTLIVGGVVGMLALWLGSAQALTIHKVAAQGSDNIEAAFARCLNGEQIRLSDGTTWFCLRGGK
jgi:hypothetical protein